MNRYKNGGRVREVVEEAVPPPPVSPLPPPQAEESPPPPAETGPCPPAQPGGGGSDSSRKTPPGTLRDLKRGLDGVLRRLDPKQWETEDLLTAGILYLLYRESGDGDWLIVMLAYLFL